jgi:xylan 1,4-beta-xylosidase
MKPVVDIQTRAAKPDIISADSHQRFIVSNPVIKGFNPDPSIVRVDEDYYLVTSTFEWFPMIPIYHSRDLGHWRLIGHALTSSEHVDLHGVPDSGGVWAPSLSYNDGLFYLTYTIVYNSGGAFKDLKNFLVTSPSILGPWSKPVFLNASGFDPSLFHDDDGRKWVVNVQWNHRPHLPRFDGIVLQEYSPKHQRLVGPIFNICRKTLIIEGPNIYKHGGYYYLMLAEGGTSWEHSVSMARSKRITGPYEIDPLPQLLTSAGTYSPLQKAGHGELVHAPSGQWFMPHLCSRPLLPERRCPLGRETAIQEVTWSEDGWLRLASGGTEPEIALSLPGGVSASPWPVEPPRDDFDDLCISPHWQSLRDPISPDWASTTLRPGFLRLFGRESLHSRHCQSLLARRITGYHTMVETTVEFSPHHYSQMAGLIIYYDTKNHIYLRLTHDEHVGRVLGVVQTDRGQYAEDNDSQLDVNDWSKIYLRGTIDGATLRFSASGDGSQWHTFPCNYDFTKLSADYAGGFTGAMAGICVQDLGGTRLYADFDYFTLCATD